MTGIGDALVDILVHAVQRGRPRARDVLEWLTEVAQPPAGVRLVTEDGAEYTGVVLVESNRPRLMIALRVGGARRPPARELQYQHPVYGEPRWRPDDDAPFP